MRYLCLVHVDEEVFARMTPEEDKKQQRESVEHDEELRRTGHLIAASPIQGPETATFVRVRNGKVSMTDGPFVETKEHLGGFLVIDAKDLNEALAIAAKLPVARFCSIEVRPTWDFDLD